MLGPHVVGQRVVVRRVLRGRTGPTGGPALTDVLGTCRSWADGLCEVETADGAVVAIRVADIVSGKPVPPRPSVRHRVPVREAELHTFSLWPDVETAPLGEWQLRGGTATGGPDGPRRARSCLALGDPGRPLPEAAAQVVGYYEARGREPLVAVEVGGEPAAGLTALGWTEVPGGRATFLIASVARAQRRCRGGDVAAPAHRVPEDPLRLLVEARTGQDPQGPAAVGRAALDGDWLGLHGLHVDERHRRQGLATAVLGELLAWGAERGATTAWLHVEVDNLTAARLYEGLGFTAHHEMTYLRAPDAPRAVVPGP